MSTCVLCLQAYEMMGHRSRRPVDQPPALCHEVQSVQPQNEYTSTLCARCVALSVPRIWVPCAFFKNGESSMTGITFFSNRAKSVSFIFVALIFVLFKIIFIIERCTLSAALYRESCKTFLTNGTVIEHIFLSSLHC